MQREIKKRVLHLTVHEKKYELTYPKVDELIKFNESQLGNEGLKENVENARKLIVNAGLPNDVFGELELGDVTCIVNLLGEEKKN